MTKLGGFLQIQDLELKANLGWRDKELLTPQAITLSMDIFYLDAPEAIHTDDLKDTICYAELIEKIRHHISQKKYRLIEHLSHDIYELTQPLLPPNSRLYVKVTKKPKIEGLTSVSYSCMPNCKEEK